MRRMTGGGGPGGQIFNIGKSKAALFDAENKVKSSQIIGEGSKVKFGDGANQKINEVVRRMIHLLITDVCTQSQKNLNNYQPKSIDDVRSLPHLIDFSIEVKKEQQELKQFLRHLAALCVWPQSLIQEWQE